MKTTNFYQSFLFFFLALFSFNVFAWNHSVQLGYGYSHDPRHTKYNNMGFLLTSDLFPVWRTDYTLGTITGAIGQWHTTAPTNKDLTTGAVSLALRWYMFDVKNYPAYFLGSAGPAILSHRQFGLNKQAKNITIQTNLGLGMEFNPFDVNLRLVHYSNASLATPNHGFNILYLLSFGYLF